MINIKNSTILVTGGAGFIGSHLVKELASLSAKVVVLDIEINPKSLFVSDGVYRYCEFVIADLRDKGVVNKVFEQYLPQYVFHLAAEPLVEKSFDNPYNAFETNIMGTVNVLESCRRLNSVSAVIVASSDKAYGKTKKPYTEDFPLRGDHPYDVSKSSADLISYAYYKSYGLPVVITRFGNVYGEGDLHMNRIIPGICEAIIKKKILEIRSNGKYVRDYLYVKDVVDGYIFLISKISSVAGEAFNFSSNDTLSVLDLVKRMEKILKTKIKYKILNTAKNEIPYQHLVDSKIRRLGWKTKYNLYSSLQQIFDWYKYDFYKN